MSSAENPSSLQAQCTITMRLKLNGSFCEVFPCMTCGKEEFGSSQRVIWLNLKVQSEDHSMQDHRYPCRSRELGAPCRPLKSHVLPMLLD